MTLAGRFLNCRTDCHIAHDFIRSAAPGTFSTTSHRQGYSLVAFRNANRVSGRACAVGGRVKRGTVRGSCEFAIATLLMFSLRLFAAFGSHERTHSQLQGTTDHVDHLDTRHRRHGRRQTTMNDVT